MTDLHDDPTHLLPHGPAMVYVDRILEHGPQHVVCRVVPGTKDALYAEDGRIPAAMAVEYMGQAMCVFAGLRRGESEPAEVGYIIAVRGLVLAVPGFVLGEALTVTATYRGGDERLARFETSIDREGQVLASAMLTVFHPTPAELA